MFNLRQSLNAAVLASISCCVFSQLATAANLNISNSPVEFSSGVQSNILFLLDDSGSMDLGVVAPVDPNNVFPTNPPVSSFVGSTLRVATGNFGCEIFYTHPDTDNTAATTSPTGDPGPASNIGGNSRTAPTEALLASLSAANGGTTTSGVWRTWYSGHNKIYYDPEVVFLPWRDTSSTSFPNVTVTSGAHVDAPLDPANPTDKLRLTEPLNYDARVNCTTDDQNGTTQTVTGFYPARYYTSDDTNATAALSGNGFADPTDQHTLIQIRRQGDNACTNGATCPATFNRSSSRTDCVTQNPDGSRVCTRTEELQNFANWFSYYRKRDLSTKAAVSFAIAPSSARVGFGRINQANGTAFTGTSGLEIKDVNDISPQFDQNGNEIFTNRTNKNTLLGNLFGVSPNGFTPLRRALERAGQYYETGTNTMNFSAGASDPILSEALGGSCQQNFTLLFTDGFWNGDPPNVGDADSNGNTNFDKGTGRLSYGDANTATNTLADVAMHFYERDLRGLNNLVPTITGVDENPGQHMVTFGIAFGATGTITAATPGANAEGNPNDVTAAFPWPTPSANAPETIDDLRHAAWNGRGAFLSANNAISLNAALSRALNQIAEASGQAAAVGASTTSFNTDTLLFQSLFDSRRWSGDVLTFTFPNGLILSEDPQHRAARRLDTEKNATGSDRAIVTYNRDTRAAVSFNIAADGTSGMTAAQLRDLRTDKTGTLEAGTTNAKRRVEYLRGDRDCENRSENQSPTKLTKCGGSLPFRPRGNPTNGSFPNDGGRLGDIIHSAPDFVGRPLSFFYPDTFPFPTQNPNVANDGSYSDFEFNNQSRPGVIYVGANDGMLHAFATGVPQLNGTLIDSPIGPGYKPGEELFGYIPSAVFSPINTNNVLDVTKGLHVLTQTNYTHQFYVDGTPAIDPAYITLNSTLAWRDILVGSLRAGGQGLFAINVSNPNNLTTEAGVISNVMWEFNDRDTAPGASVNGDPDLGFTFSKPIITLVQTGTQESQASSYTWVAIFGNGYNNMVDDGSASTTGNAVLYIVNLTTGTLIKKIDTGVGKDPNNANDTPNGLSSVTGADIDLNGTTDVVYAGDLKGNLWKFDLRGGTSNWDIPYSAGGVGQQANNKRPVFKAVLSTNNPVPQPITTTPFVTGGPVGKGGLLISFGTGKLFETTDQSPTGLQTFYTVWDQDPDNAADFVPFTKDNLLQQQFTQTTFVANGQTQTVLINSDLAINYDNPNDQTIGNNEHLGWYVDLNAFPGGLNNQEFSERVFVDPIVIGGIVFFNSSIPDSAICSGGGDSVLYTLDRLDGGNPNFPVLDFNGDGFFNDNDKVLDPNNNKVNIAGVKKDGIATEPTFVGDRIFQGGVGEGNVGTGVNKGGDGDADDCIAGSECEKRNVGASTGRLSWRELLPK